MKYGAALAGGGARGAYQAGAWRAFHENGVVFDVISGTSIGAVNGALMVQGDFDAAYDLWQTITIGKVMKNGLNFVGNLDYYLEHRDQLLPFFKEYSTNRGADISPYRKMLGRVLNEKRFFDSKIDFSLMTVSLPGFVPREVKKSEMKPGYLTKWVLASSACFPAFPLTEIDSQNYIDGGYYENLPMDSCFRLGADRVLAIALDPGASKRKYANHPLVSFLEPSRPLGSLLAFENDAVRRNLALGYLDARRFLRCSIGSLFAFHLPSDEERALGERLAFDFCSMLTRRDVGEVPAAAPAFTNLIAPAGLSDTLFKLKSPGDDLFSAFVGGLEEVMEYFSFEPYREYTLSQALLLCRERLSSIRAGAGDKKIHRLRRLIRSGAGPRVFTSDSRRDLFLALLLDFSSLLSLEKADEKFI